MDYEIKNIPLIDICDEVVDCPHSTPKWTKEGVFVLRNSNIKNGRLDLSNPSFTDELHYENRSRRAKLQAGDLVITREAPMGEVCQIPDDLKCCLGQRMVLLRPSKEKCDGKYLLYALQSRKVQHEINSYDGTGSTVSNLRIPVLKNLSIPTPSLSIQKNIANILGTLDAKIELNRKSNKNLEEISKTLFKSWFVDFDPVRAKLEGNATGLPDEISNLFPDSFEDSELGKIPHGWKISTLGNSFNWIHGRTWDKKYRVSASEISCFGSNGLMGKSSESMGDDRIIIMGNRGSCGALNYFHGKFWVTNNAYFLQKNDHKYFEFVRAVVRSIDFSPFVGGSSNPFMPLNNFSHLFFVLPSEKSLSCFNELATISRERIEILERESSILKTLRDVLLNRLISGQIIIPDAEKIIEEVGI